MDSFFTKEICDRCGKPFNGARIMSMFNTDVICMACKEAEKKKSDYQEAVEADIAHIKAGDYNFGGIGYRK